MRSPLTRAWQETVRSYRLTWGTAARSLLGSAAAVGLIYQVLGESAAMTEAWVILLTLLAVAGACFLPAFLWNLWLAPYKIVHDRLDDAMIGQETSQAVNEEQEQRAILNRKRHDARREMKRFRCCIDYRHKHTLHPQKVPQDVEIDSDYRALKEKYSTWFPDGLSVYEMVDWVNQIDAILRYNDYETSNARIKCAVTKGSWDK